MREQRVSSRYAKALTDLAIENKIEFDIKNDLDLIKKAVNESRELLNYINSPIIRSFKKKEVFTELFSPKIHNITMMFLKLLAEKGRESLVFDIIEEFNIEFNIRHKRLPVEIMSANDLSEDIKTKTIEKIESITGMTVLPTYTLDKSIIGGLMIRYADIIFDASIKSKLNNLHSVLLGGSFSAA